MADDQLDPDDAAGDEAETTEAGAAEEPARPRLEIVDTHEGDVLLWLSWGGTGLLALVSVAAVLRSSLEVVLLAVSLLMFVLGCLLFARAFLFAVSTRREDLISIGGLFLLLGSAPRRVQANLLGSLGVQVLISLVTAGVRPYTALAFGVLAPMYGLGLTGLWGAIHGTFPRREVADEPTRPPRATRGKPE